MRRYIKDFLILAAMIGAGVLLQWQWSKLAVRMDRLSSSHQEFAQRAQEAIGASEQDGYLGRIQSFLQVYKQDMVESQGGRVEWSDEIQKRVVRQLENGAIDEAQYKEKTQILALVKTAYQTLLDAQWKSQLTLPGQGDTRLDIYRIRQLSDSEGKPVLEADFFLWGIEKDTEVTWGQAKTMYWQQAESADGTHTDPAHAEDAAPTGTAPVALTTAETSARPSVFVRRPTRVVPQFPSYVAIGTLQLPEIPEAADLMDLELQYTVRKGEDEHVSQLNWAKVPIPAGWRSGETPATKDEVKAAN